jgi:hypothetical protein
MPPTKRARKDGSGDESGSEYVPSGGEEEVPEEAYVAPSSSNSNDWVLIQSAEDPPEISKYAIRFSAIPKDIKAQMNKALKDDSKMLFTVSPDEDEFDGLVKEYDDDDKQEAKNESAKEFFESKLDTLESVAFKGMKIRAIIDVVTA